MKARYCLVLLSLIVLVSQPTWAENHDSTGEVVKREVLKAWDSYLAAFSAGRTDIVANRVYAAPSYQMGNSGVNLRMTTDDVKASFDEIHSQLEIEQYDRSETDAVVVCVLNGSTALLSAHFTRYRTDDSPLMTGASSYLFGKLDGNWQIFAIIGNPSRKLITCE